MHIVDGSAFNVKITTRADLALAENILKSRPKPKPTGRCVVNGELVWGRGVRTVEGLWCGKRTCYRAGPAFGSKVYPRPLSKR